MRIYGRHGNDLSNFPAGYGFFDAKNIGSGTFFPRNSGATLMWHKAPHHLPGVTIASATVAASGLRAVPFVSPSYRNVRLAGVGIRLENSTPGNPPASGILALWDGVAGSNNKYPGKLLWQSESIGFAASGYFYRYPNVLLEKGQTYWLSLLSSRNTIVAAVPTTGYGFSFGSANSLPTAQSSSCVGVSYSYTSSFTGLPAYYPTGGTLQTTAATSPIIWYSLIEAD